MINEKIADKIYNKIMFELSDIVDYDDQRDIAKMIIEYLKEKYEDDLYDKENPKLYYNFYL